MVFFYGFNIVHIVQGNMDQTIRFLIYTVKSKTENIHDN